MKTAWLLIFAASLAWGAIGPAAQAADQVDSSVEAGRSALGSHWSYNWYDEATDGIRVLELEPETSSPTRSKPSSSTGSGGSLEPLVVIAAVIILGTVAIMLARAFLKAEESSVVAETRHSREIDIARIEHLPFRIEEGKTDLLTEARRLYAQQRYGEAMVYLYSHQLLELDRLHLIHLAKGKTNRQYLREAAANANVSGPLAASMVAFEDVFFGHHPLERARFEACLAGVERLAAAQGAPQ